MLIRLSMVYKQWKQFNLEFQNGNHSGCFNISFPNKTFRVFLTDIAGGTYNNPKNIVVYSVRSVSVTTGGFLANACSIDGKEPGTGEGVAILAIGF